MRLDITKNVTWKLLENASFGGSEINLNIILEPPKEALVEKFKDTLLQ